jgi:transposase
MSGSKVSPKTFLIRPPQMAGLSLESLHCSQSMNATEFAKGPWLDLPLQGHEGRKGGRPKALTPEKKALAYEALQNRNQTVKEIAGAIGVGEATVYRYQRDLKEQGKLSWAK